MTDTPMEPTGKGVCWSQIGLLLLLVALPSPAEILFYEGFESGGPGKFGYVGGDASYPNSGAHSGNYCGKMTLPEGANNTGCMWIASSRMENIYVMAWWKFPTDFVFGSGYGSTHKAIIWEGWDWQNPDTYDARHFINFHGSGTSPTIIFNSELAEGQNHHASAQMPCDGKWHSVEVYRDFANNRVKVWYDDVLVMDVASNLGTSKTTGSIKIGAYMNSVNPTTQSFYMDDITISTERIGKGSDTAPSLTVTTASLPNATVGTPYGQNLEATGGIPPYTWSLAGGSVPTRPSLSSVAGRIFGAPSAAGTFTFTAKAKDSGTQETTRQLAITVSTSADITIGNALKGTASGRLLSQTVCPGSGIRDIEYRVSQSGPVSLRVFTTNGRLLHTLAQGHHDAGTHQVQWNTGNQKGLHVMVLQQGSRVFVERLMLTD